MSFACPHFTPDPDACLRVRCECIPGRPGCAIAKNTVFATPWEERLQARLEEKQRSLPAVAPTRRLRGA